MVSFFRGVPFTMERLLFVAASILSWECSCALAFRGPASTRLPSSLARRLGTRWHGPATTRLAAFLSRRDVVSCLVGSSIAVGTAAPVQADDGDLTSQLFNPDGSLKDSASIVTEAQTRTVTSTWDVSDDLLINADGTNVQTPSGTSVEWSYTVPEKWSAGTGGGDLYLDRSEGINAKACDGILVYQAPGTAKANLLSKASTIGVPQALSMAQAIPGLDKADLISGRTRKNADGLQFYEFDLGRAPKTCEDSAENLGLGFCPFDSLFLISATVLDDKLYVLVVQSDRGEWKRASSDLKRVRSSFAVGRAA